MLPIFIISLKSSQSRRDLCTTMMNAAGLPFTFFDAVDGAALPDRLKSRHYDDATNMDRFKRPLCASEVGCYLSHLQLWEHIAQTAPKAALILEDDARLETGLKSFLTQIDNYDLEDVYLKLDGAPDTLGLDTADLTKMTLGHQKVVNTPQIAPRTTGYVLGGRAAQKLVARRSKFFRPVDIDIKHYWEHGVPVWTVMPQLISETRSRGDESTIEAARQMAKGANPVWRFWKNTTYQYNYLKQRRMNPPAASRLMHGEN